MNEKCPCFSGRSYNECCKPYHEGDLPQSALALMRSRYAAYALCLPEYIIRTTHPKNPCFSKDLNQWKQEILDFCKKTEFLGLEILESVQGAKEALVIFKAFLRQGDSDVSFIEKSRFVNHHHHWLYRDKR